MARQQEVAIWPASIREVVESVETPYMLLDANAGVVARAAWWALKRLKALKPYFQIVSKWTYVPHEQAALHEAMLKAVDYDLRFVADGKAVFIIGGKTFSDLVSAPAFRDQMVFATGPFGMDDGYRGRRMFDIPIHIIPNMIGMAVVPRVLIETKRI